MPIKTCWLLDSDAELIDPIQIAHPEVKITYGPSDFDKYHDLDDTIFLKADFNEGWWHRVWAGRTPDLLAASPPANHGPQLDTKAAFNAQMGFFSSLWLQLLECLKFRLFVLKKFVVLQATLTRNMYLLLGRILGISSCVRKSRTCPRFCQHIARACL